MQWKYCDFCGNISIKPLELGSKVYKCPKCDWQGVPNEGSMETINLKAKAYRPGTKFLPPAPLHGEDDENQDMAPDSEYAAKIRPSTGTGKIPKNQELLNRLKGKGFGDGEFI